MAKSFTLSKEERLKSRKAIAELFDKGRKIPMSPFLAYYLFRDVSAAKPVRMGVGVSGRNFRKAVDRNRIKRLTREAFRLQKPGLQEILGKKASSLDLFLIYTGRELPVFEEVFSSVGRIIQKLNVAAE
ncbi:MAG TPA: ribonuclease P protein component [Chitinophagaceae bacterium]|nr:ribonuclease P protein component [Chitinophagaceae bacterium]